MALAVYFFSTWTGAASSLRSKAQEAEFHFQVCEDSSEVIKNKLEKLNLKINEEKKMRVYYFDDVALGLYHQNLIIRLRIKAKKAELTLKYRATELNRQNQSAFGDCEWDVYRQSKQRSCVQSHELTLEQAQQLVQHPERLLSSLNGEEKLFLKHYQLDIKDVFFKALGPVSATKFEYNNDWYFEDWFFDEATSIKEISWHGTATNLSATYQKQLTKLKSVGLKICPTDFKKTKFTLDYFLNRNH